MNCTSCGAVLPPGAASCPVCGTPTPYNVTGPRGGSSQYDPTIGASQGPYSGNPPTPSYPYNSGNPPTPPSPYNAPPPTGYGAPSYGAPGVPLADPYSTVSDPYNQPANNYAQRQQQPSFSPPPPAPMPVPPPKKSGRGRLLVLAIIAVVVILVAAGIIGAVAVNNNNTQRASATATAIAQTQLTATSAVNTNLTATAAAVTTTYPFSNNLVLNDPLSNNSKGFKWDEATPSSSQGGCTFQGQSYHVSEPQTGFFNYCIASGTNFANFTYEVEMMIAKGDAGGLIFRANTSGQNPSFYYFRLNQDGTYNFFLYVDSSGTNARTLAHGNAKGFNTGLNQTNLISIVAKGSTLSLYINKQLLTSVTDSTYTSGQIGLAADYINGATEVVYTNAKVWKLS
ncbi:MAG TPA: hypothetical protein VKU38_20130 [Ktedonobacteraceae bacterium]|nr:hypothetical protein [Ktedonobacteraceae bacterium]